MRHRNMLWGYAFILLWIVGFAIFTAWPLFYSFFLSFNKVTIKIGYLDTEFIGWANYLRAFTLDTRFLPAFTSTVWFIGASVPMILVFSTILAIALNQKIRFRWFFRLLFFMPFVIISGSVMSELMSGGAAYLEGVDKYGIYQYIAFLPEIISRPVLYVFDNIILLLWFSSAQILIILAGLQKIDKAQYEAAYVDGASAWEAFWKITLPALKPLIMINAVYTIVTLAAFSNTELNALIQLRMFEQGIIYSYSSALSWLYFATVLLIIGITVLIIRGRGDGA